MGGVILGNLVHSASFFLLPRKSNQMTTFLKPDTLLLPCKGFLGVLGSWSPQATFGPEPVM